MKKISLEHITKIFDEKVVAVDDLNIEFPAGKITCLLGPSGCGKTTTMRLIAGLEKPTTGRIYFDDQDVTDIPTRERNISMIFQFPVLYPLSVFENIAIPLIAKRTPKNEINKKVKEIAELLQLSPVLHENVKALEVGMRQRVSLAKAFVREVDVCLLDEPLSNVDPQARVTLRAELRKLASELNQTIIYVTHDQSEALTVGDMIGVMNKGRLLQYDNPENIYLYPQDPFVAWFIGDPGMNLIDCSLEEKNGRYLLDAAAFTYDVTYLMETTRQRSSSRELILGIRPEHIQVDVKKGGDEWICLKPIIIEPYTGGMIIAHFQANGKVIRAKVPSSVPIRENEEAWVHFPREYIRLFDKKTDKPISI
jgi:multiple sugar transport system ATP-binding protein